jgi:hypothetical protein
MATFLILPKRTAANASVVVWVMDEFEALIVYLKSPVRRPTDILDSFGAPNSTHRARLDRGPRRRKAERGDGSCPTSSLSSFGSLPAL